MLTIGITGSIGVGKTTLAHMIRDMGIPVYSADEAVSGLLAPEGAAVKKVVEFFPSTLIRDKNGAAHIDKEELAKIIFFDREKKQKLEEYIHPMVRSDANMFIENMKEHSHNIVTLEIPLLFEAGWDKHVDVTVCVSCSLENQKKRVLTRPGMTSEKFDAIVSGQLTDKEKQERADYIILNDGDLEETRQNLENVIGRIMERSTGQDN